MSQFENEAFQFDFLKSLVQTVKTICCHGNRFIISFYMQIVTYRLESFILSKSILIICSQVIHT